VLFKRKGVLHNIFKLTELWQFMEKKMLVYAVMALLIADFSLFLPLAVARHYIFNEDYYKKELSGLGVYSKFPQADSMIEGTIRYLKGEDVALDFLNENEAGHMADVRALVARFNSLLAFSAILFFVLLLLLFLLSGQDFLRHMLKSLIFGSTAVVIAFAALFLLSANFSSLFAVFHSPFFESGSWIFPADSTLVNLFPEKFFFDMTYRIAEITLIAAIIILGISLFAIRTKNLKRFDIIN